jgi:hypothetical protein
MRHLGIVSATLGRRQPLPQLQQDVFNGTIEQTKPGGLGYSLHDRLRARYHVDVPVNPCKGSLDFGRVGCVLAECRLADGRPDDDRSEIMNSTQPSRGR